MFFRISFKATCELHCYLDAYILRLNIIKTKGGNAMKQKASTSVKATSFWNSKDTGYHFDNCVQAVLNTKVNDSKHQLLFASDCSCGIGGCGDSGGCDSY